MKGFFLSHSLDVSLANVFLPSSFLVFQLPWKASTKVQLRSEKMVRGTTTHNTKTSRAPLPPKWKTYSSILPKCWKIEFSYNFNFDLHCHIKYVSLQFSNQSWLMYLGSTFSVLMTGSRGGASGASVASSAIFEMNWDIDHMYI